MNIAEAELTAALSPRVNMRLAAQCFGTTTPRTTAYPSATPAETWDPATGVETSVAPLNPAALAELANYNHDMSRDIQVQNDYRRQFQGGRHLPPALAWLGVRAVRNDPICNSGQEHACGGHTGPIRRASLHPL